MKNLWKKFRHWCCKVGLCNLNKCNCDCHKSPKRRSKAYYPTIKETRSKKAKVKKAASVAKSPAKNSVTARLVNLKKKN